jgi:hypothetical protein
VYRITESLLNEFSSRTRDLKLARRHKQIQTFRGLHFRPQTVCRDWSEFLALAIARLHKRYSAYRQATDLPKMQFSSTFITLATRVTRR